MTTLGRFEIMVSRLGIVFVISACFVCGCAFIPTPVRLVNKPHQTKPGERNNVKVYIIVKDERPKAMQQVNMCGLMRNGFMIPTSFAFLAHSEHLDQIMVHHLRRNFDHLGFTVVGTHPRPPGELSSRKVSSSELDSGTVWKAWWQSHTQNLPGAKQKNKPGSIEALGEQHVSAWGPDVDVSSADCVVEVKIRKFFCDVNWFGVFAWSSVNFAVCSTQDATRKVVFGKKLKGFGYGMGIVSHLEAYAMAMNTAYWFVLHGTEKTAASAGFRDAVKKNAPAKSGPTARSRYKRGSPR